MNSYWKYIKIIFVMHLLTGCQQAESKLFRISLEEAIDYPVLLEKGEYIDSIKYVPLETTDSCFIGDIVKIERWNNLYYIRDLSENLYLFTDKGKFVRKIGVKGRGPEEYNVLTDFTVDPENGDIYLIAVGKIMIYGIEGQLKRSVEIDSNWQVCTFDREGHLIFILPVSSGKKEPYYLLMICNKEGKMVCQIPGQRVETEFGFFNWVNKQEGKIFYKEEFSDTLFYLDVALKPCAYACVDFGDYSFNPSLFYFKQAENWPKYYRLSGVFDFNRCMILNVQRGLVGQNLTSYLFDKHLGIVGSLEKNREKTGFIINGVRCYPRASWQNQLICNVSAVSLMEQDWLPDRHLQKLAGNLEENANPVLMILFMK